MILLYIVNGNSRILKIFGTSIIYIYGSYLHFRIPKIPLIDIVNNVGPPSDLSWLINPHNYSYLRAINHSDWSYT